jgi:hypothetical protein
MSSTLFILTITCYLLSLVATLTASFFARLIPGKLVNAAVILHVLFLISYLFAPGSTNPLSLPGWSNYLFIAFFCSGILISGVLVRKPYHLILKGYFLLYLLSAMVFIFSPSRMLGFIASGQPDSFNPPRYHIADNYYLVGQDRSGGSEQGNIAFKLVREMGFFHKTLTRNILLPPATDSLKLLEYQEQKGMKIRAFFLSGNISDSTDLSLNFMIARDSSEVITRKKPGEQK